MSDNLVDQLSIGAAMGNGKADSDMHIHDVMMTPIVDSLKKCGNIGQGLYNLLIVYKKTDVNAA